MNRNLRVSKSIEINSIVEEVWDALTNPEKIRAYLFGTETITNWKVGSPIVFQGEYEGHKYKDKGNVLENKPNELLKYDYWSGFSGLEDKPENYSIVTYEIEKSANNRVIFRWTQEGFANEQGQKNSENGKYGMLEQIKKLAEKE
ncbi:SRPBCC domain-containing protein [candidate division KSB1 bacterium]|nr:SRPBCC domain-containing protein [candidate division KSB1 bacterium]